jgi:hypothetical protein
MQEDLWNLIEPKKMPKSQETTTGQALTHQPLSFTDWEVEKLDLF